MTTETSDSLAKLLSLAVHEFRTPVAVVSGYLRMLLRHFGDNLTDQQRKLLQESEKSCGSLANLLTELSDLAHLEDGRLMLRREPIPIFSLLKQVAEGVHEAEDRGVKLEVRDGGRDGVVMGDPDRLRTALESLLAATLRERAEAGTVVAACSIAKVPPVEGLAVIAVADAGTAEELATSGATITAPFDEYRGGLGFRLPMAARIIAAHGGRVSSPVAARGRLAIVLSLPLATASESPA
jgi:signal transduction histidine kinase